MAESSVAEFPVAEYEKWLLYRFEWMGMLLDLLSRQARRIVSAVNFLDVKGMGLKHRKCLDPVVDKPNEQSSDTHPNRSHADQVKE